MEKAYCEKLILQTEIATLVNFQKTQQSELELVRAELHSKDNRLKEMTELYPSLSPSPLFLC